MNSLHIGVSGINAVDNPGPGIGVIRSLKEEPDLSVYILGLAYDAMDPGIYLDWLVDKAYILPYPSVSEEDFISRVLYIHEKSGIDVIIPTLDAELPIYIKAERTLASKGIRTFLPSKEQFDLRGKTKLKEVAERIGILVPESLSISSSSQLLDAVEALGYPIMIKGLFYKAYMAHTYQEAVGYFHKIVAEWGYPVIVQRVVKGEEMNVIGVGDGEGRDLGLIAIKKLWTTALGKIWTGVTIKNEVLLEAARRFVEEFKWKGAFELECIVEGEDLYLIEINPRFPAWVYFSTGVGVNLPARLVKAALGMDVDRNCDYMPGKLYVRYTYEVVTDMSHFQSIVTRGETR